MADRARGIDISKYDLVFNPSQATTRPDFVIQRASYGMVKDQAFKVLQPGVLEMAVRGAYHYLSSAVPWRDAARRFLDICQGKYHFYVCDFESGYNNLNTAFRDACLQWIAYVEYETKRPVLLYTNIGLYNTWFSPLAVVNKIPLWLAWYGWYWPVKSPDPASTPSLPKARTAWTIWQYWDRGPGADYGLGRPTVCDLDVFNGSVEQLHAWLKMVGPEPPTPPLLTLEERVARLEQQAKEHGWDIS